MFIHRGKCLIAKPVRVKILVVVINCKCYNNIKSRRLTMEVNGYEH